ncbi:S-layer homology domain-containing protein [Paenibacillus frigoriresistens]|uniref:S-layer homology domain-containing protein n=1 Tax=Paenibacillus alginolyticus TaxID=59839 RepID=UPI0015653272|nr:S-layer homology domain-containing protein [Paenibacillus frigoriresistens]NRF94797.1 S-layer homology domain-containing protein [Paenibacillus frigoriresistens]
MKKLGLIASMVSLFSLCNVTGATASGFGDVSSSSPYISYINDLGRLGVTDGVAPGQFGPSKTLTRAQFAKFVAVAFQLKDDGSSVPFQDIQSHWAAPYVRAAYQAGIIEGTSASTFTPELPVKREEAATMIWRLAQSKGIAAPAALKFQDSPDAWAVPAVSGVLSKGWYAIDARKSGESWSYRPRDNMTRQEMAALLAHSMKDVPGSTWTSIASDMGTTQDSALPSWQQSLKDHLLNQETDFQITLDDPNEFQQIKSYVNALLADNDYLHYIYHGMNYEYDGVATVTFKVSYLESKSQTDYVSEQATTIVASITHAGMNDFEKEKAVHDYVISHLAYDKSLVEHTAYGGLTKGTTVCQGYALLTYRLLTEAGISNKIVEGHAGGQLHTWNLVKLDGNWYHLDTTWDDPVPDVKGRLMYHYFNLTDAQMKRDHTWTGTYPTASQDFIQALGQEVQSGAMDAAASQALLSSTGLSGETAENTADSISAVQALLQGGISARQSQITFRYKSSLGSAQSVMKAALTNDIVMNNNVGRVTYEFGTDTRLTGYTSLTVNITYGS